MKPVQNPTRNNGGKRTHTLSSALSNFSLEEVTAASKQHHGGVTPQLHILIIKISSCSILCNARPQSRFLWQPLIETGQLRAEEGRQFVKQTGVDLRRASAGLRLLCAEALMNIQSAHSLTAAPLLTQNLWEEIKHTHTHTLSDGSFINWLKSLFQQKGRLL